MVPIQLIFLPTTYGNWCALAYEIETQQGTSSLHK
jgi:hypothetical protein